MKLLLTILLLAGLSYGAGDTAWTHVSSAQGIDIYYRPDTTTGHHWIKGVVTDSVRMEVVAQVLLDVNNYRKWMEQLDESKVVDSISPDEFVVYNYYNLPWPMSDRDIYVKVKITRNIPKGLVTATIDKVVSAQYPPREGVIRVPSMKGTLSLQSLSPQVTRGTFVELFDMGGSIPNWAKSYLNKHTPNYILGKVREACKQPFYISAEGCIPN